MNLEQTSSSLVRGITNFENHQSWFEFNHLYSPMIRNILRTKGLRHCELEDAVQEVYLSMLSTIEQFRYDREKGKFRSWISKITQRAASDYRSRQEHPSVDPQQLEESQPGREKLPELTDERMQLCLRLARSRFDERTWLPFYLRVIEESPVEEIQRITKMNRNAIYQAVHRVKRCIREMISHLDWEQEDHGNDE